MVRKLTSIVGGLAIAAGLAACGDTTTTPPAATSAAGGSTSPAITILNFTFSPSPVTVKAGTAVTWTNQDSAAHTATSDDGKFDSGNLKKDGTFSFTFASAGHYKYHCAIHSSMVAEVVVQ